MILDYNDGFAHVDGNGNDIHGMSLTFPAIIMEGSATWNKGPMEIIFPPDLHIERDIPDGRSYTLISFNTGCKSYAWKPSFSPLLLWRFNNINNSDVSGGGLRLKAPRGSLTIDNRGVHYHTGVPVRYIRYISFIIAITHSIEIIILLQ
jgi:hypothetical protein